jgi:hypothetical protein
MNTQTNRLDAILQRFVALNSGVRQRDESWYTAMGTTVGGSEVAALLGCNPYSNIHDVVASKVALLQGRDTWAGGGAPCWWGILFEDLAATYTEIELGGTVRGDEICVQRYPGHRNSPDGYIVAHSRASAGGEPLDLWTTDKDPSAACHPRIFLLEFKCPLSRRPDGGVPKQYLPQLWSGLAVSPVAHAGLFVDVVFRKCALADLGPGPEYDREYHRRGPEYGAAVAWGLIGIYAPALDAPRWARIGKPARDSGLPPADLATDAWRMRVEAAAAGAVLAPELEEAIMPAGAKTPAKTKAANVIELGSAAGPLFDRALDAVNRRHFSCHRLTPCLADGRGLDLHTEAAVHAAIARLARAPPPHCQLLGVLPWKIFEVNFVPVSRRPTFMEEVGPLIEEVHRRVQEALATPDPEAHLRTLRRAAARPKSGVSADEALAMMYS